MDSFHTSVIEDCCVDVCACSRFEASYAVVLVCWLRDWRDVLELTPGGSVLCPDTGCLMSCLH